MISLRSTTSNEKPLQASKWLQSQALLSIDELRDLFKTLEDSVGNFYLFACGVVITKDKQELLKKDFLKAYEGYINTLKKGEEPDIALCRSIFSPAMTVSTDALFTIPVGDDKQIIRVSRPVIQLQAHTIDYSIVDKKFHSMVFGFDSIAWGIQFSYPQLFQDNETKQVEIVKKGTSFPNTALFRQLQKWMRKHTLPTPFIAEERIINVPMRLGKECFSWINHHPQLIRKNLRVSPRI